MADRIKGITVKIGGDTTNLSKSLEGVNKQLKSTQDQLKDVDKLLKLDPGNTELLKQKQELLSKSIGETKEKLAAEKAALEAAQRTDGFPTDKMDALKREVIDTTEKLKELKKESSDFGTVFQNQMKVAGNKMQEVGGKISNVGDSMSTHITAPIIAAGTAAVAAFNQVDEGMDTIAAKTGASGSALEDMENIAKNMAVSIPTDFQTAGAAVGEVNTRFGLTGDALDTLSTKFVKFADLNNTDVSTSVDDVSSVLHAFGMNASDAGGMLDVLNSVGQDTGIDMSTLSNLISSNAGSFQEMGYNAAQAAQFLGTVEMSGLDTSAAMMGLKTAMKNATKDGKTMQQALSEFSSTMQSNASDTDKLQAAYDLFGSKAGGAIYNAMTNGKLSFDAMSKSMSDYSGNLDTTYESTLDGTDKLKTSFNALQEAGASVGETLGDTLAPILQQVADALVNFSKFWESLPEPIQNVVLMIIALVAAIGPILSIIGGLITNIGIITTALAGVNLAILPIIAIIGAVIAVIVLLIANWDTVKQVAQDCWSAITRFVTDAWNAITAIFSSVGQWFSDRFTEAANGISNAWSGVTGFFSGIHDAISNAFSSIGSWFSDRFTEAANNITNAFSNIGSFFSGVWDTISGGFAALNPFSWGSDLINGIADGITSAIGSVTDAVGNVAGVISSWLHFSRPDVGPLKEYETWMPDFISGLAKGINQSKSMVTNAMSELTNGMNLTPAMTLTTGGISSATDVSSNDGTTENIGDITIPVYIGNEHIDTIVVKASQRVNYRSGGR